MDHASRFPYVEFCRGLNARNTLIPIRELGKAITASLEEAPKIPLYRSVSLYPEEAMQHIAATGALAGYRGEVWADTVYIDIDTDEAQKLPSLSAVLEATRRIVGRLLHEFFCDHKALRIAFSGKKGFHIYIPQGMVGFGPNPLLHKQMAAFVMEVAGANPYDHVIYTPGRIIRLANSRHLESGLFKIMLSINDLMGLSVAEILERAAAPQPNPGYAFDMEINENLAGVWPSPEKVTKHAAVPAFKPALPILGQQGGGDVEIRADQRMCMQRIMRDKVPEGQGNERAIRLASHFIGLGTPAPIVGQLMHGWNQQMEQPMPAGRLDTTVQSAINRGGYYYGCSDTILASLCDKRCFKYKDEVAVEQINPSIFKTIYDLSKEYIRIYSENRFVSFGLTDLDYYCKGLAPGEVAMLIARSGVGKTTLMLFMAQKIHEQTGLPVLILEQELHDFLVTEKLVAMGTQRDTDQIRALVQRCISEGDLRDFDKLLDQTAEMFKGIFVCTLDRLDTDHKIELVKAFKQLHGTPAIVMEDFLGRGQEFGRTPYEIASKLARGLKTVAKVCDVPYMCLGQVSRATGEDSSTPLTINSSRDSGQIEENCDFMFGMYRPNYGQLAQDNIVSMQVLKSRRGNENQDFRLKWNRSFGTYEPFHDPEVPATSASAKFTSEMPSEPDDEDMA
jgi:energy-coupling factor transporter ATP-binding protein EcfA2